MLVRVYIGRRRWTEWFDQKSSRTWLNVFRLTVIPKMGQREGSTIALHCSRGYNPRPPRMSGTLDSTRSFIWGAISPYMLGKTECQKGSSWVGWGPQRLDSNSFLRQWETLVKRLKQSMQVEEGPLWDTDWKMSQMMCEVPIIRWHWVQQIPQHWFFLKNVTT